MKTNNINKIFDLITFCLFAVIFLEGTAFSQSKIPLLERNISISINNEKTDAALNIIAKQAGFNFSYNPAIIENNKLVTLTVTKKTVREV